MYHDLKFMRRFLTPHSELLQELFKITADQLIEGFHRLQNALNVGHANAAREIHSIEERLREECEKRGIRLASNDQKADMLDKIGLREEYELNLNRYFGNDLFDVEKVSGLPPYFLRKLAYAPGEEDQYFAGSNQAGWPTRVTPSRKRPFILFEGKVYCFNMYLVDNFYRVIERLVISERPSYREIWNVKQKECAERTAIELLSNLLPGAETIGVAYYYTRTGKFDKLNRCELDGLLIFHDYLFELEVRAGGFAEVSPVEEFGIVIKSAKSLLEKPSSQSERFWKFFEGSDEVTLVDADNRPIRTLRKSDYSHHISCAVTVDNITSLAAKAETLEQVGLAPITSWCLSLDDLMVYGDVFTTPILFLHFLNQRLAAAKSPAIEMEDEMDHLGAYIRHLNYVRYADGAGKKAHVSWLGYHKPLDEYFANLHAGVTTIPPSPQLPQFVQLAVAFLSNQATPNAIQVALALLSSHIDDAVKTQSLFNGLIERQKETGRHQVLSFEGPIGISAFVSTPEMPHQSADVKKMRDHVLAVLWRTKADSHLMIRLALDPDGAIIDLQWEYLSKTEAMREQARLQPLSNNYLESRMEQRKIGTGLRKVGRNDPCPCGSSKKFKNCCGG